MLRYRGWILVLSSCVLLRLGFVDAAPGIALENLDVRGLFIFAVG